MTECKNKHALQPCQERDGRFRCSKCGAYFYRHKRSDEIRQYACLAVTRDKQTGKCGRYCTNAATSLAGGDQRCNDHKPVDKGMAEFMRAEKLESQKLADYMRECDRVSKQARESASVQPLTPVQCETREHACSGFKMF